MNRPDKTLVVVLGATATGKTDVSIEMASRFGAPVLSCDSRQFYREIPIGTAAPTPDQMARVPHYFVGCRSVTDFYNAGRYEEDAICLLEKLFKIHDTVVMTGGSGLYVNAVCDGLDDIPAVDPAVREELVRRFHENGLPELVEELKLRDPEHYRRVDRSNSVRVIRALEVCIGTGKSYSEMRRGQKKERPFRIIKIGIEMPRALLYERIDRRVHFMLEQGLEAEARAVYPQREHNALQTVGFREMFDWFDGKIEYETAVELIKRNSRRYAKRQITWFGRDESIRWFGKDETENIIRYLEERTAKHESG